MSSFRSEIVFVLAACALGGSFLAAQGCLGSLEYLSDGVGGGGEGGAPATVSSSSSGVGASGQGGGGGAGGGGGDDCGGADLQNDEENCGACGVRCWNSACDAGECPVYLVADQQDEPLGIAVDATHVYWSNFRGRSIMRAPKGGGAPQTLSTSADSAITYVPTFLHLTSTNVVFTNTDSGTLGHNVPLATVSKAGGTTEGLAYPGGDGTADFVIDGGSIYMAHGPTGTIREGYFDGTLTDEDLATGQSFPRDVARHGSDLLWTNTGTGPGGLVRMMLPSSTPVAVEAGLFPTAQHVAANDDFVFLTTGDAVYSLEPPTFSTQQLASSQIGAGAVIADASRVYWVTGGASAALQSYDLTSGGTTDAELHVSPLPTPRELALDDEFVYWTNQGERESGDFVPNSGVVLRMRKPPTLNP